MKTHLAVSADSSASAAEPWLCVCSSVPLLCSLDPGQTKHTQTVAEMLRTNGDGHSGDPFQLENYRLRIFISCYMELFHPAPRGRSPLIPKGEFQPITLSPHLPLTRTVLHGEHWGTFWGCSGSSVLVLPKGLQWPGYKGSRWGLKGWHLCLAPISWNSSGSDCHPHWSLHCSPLPERLVPLSTRCFDQL